MVTVLTKHTDEANPDKNFISYWFYRFSLLNQHQLHTRRHGEAKLEETFAKLEETFLSFEIVQTCFATEYQ